MGTKRTRVVVAMSGGVDSSVAAALLVEQGYEVIGIMMRLWAEDGDKAHGHNRCCTPDQMSDANLIADALNIPFYVLDTRSVFKSAIVQFWVEGYAKGVTPNPCLECNRHIRFEWLLNNALALNADFLATGHYARIRRDDYGRASLLKGLDETKDQSYVLSVMGQTQLSRVMFPIGEYAKPAVRELAAKYGLSVASKGDSQDLCFLADGDYRRFLRDHSTAFVGEQISTPGPIRTRDGRVLGQHSGLPDYTIGQRKGLGLATAEPLYVIGMDSTQNTLIVGEKSELGRDHLTAARVNWISGEPPTESIRAEVKIRYKAAPAPVTIMPLPNARAEVRFDHPVRDITPGQGAVFYQGDVCLGGGIIERG
ncbi:MAG TPA: tRNA 2-thiouridine(34) synthase MnmA [Aggregatilineales bacterium]|nr:tRNA 2-thiouridine(34) synthase MnmA [Anaerolineales bacterium]HRE47489.1 tRNA 2-thiouridine(34) synthase MnmA [Aggregatilineales bacterium]